MQVIRHMMFAAAAACLCGITSTSGPAAAQNTAAAVAQGTEQLIIRAPEIVRRPLPRNGPGVPPGLTNPEIISLTRAVSYSDLDLSKTSDVAELQTRIRNTARDVCQELVTRYPKANGYVYANVDCVKKAVDDGLATVSLITGK